MWRDVIVALFVIAVPGGLLFLTVASAWRIIRTALSKKVKVNSTRK